ncbi:O-antigen ligase family protein [Ramlibacter sp. H39-3-26]|uniref:O-antigen ligase family protein n=1 Tax=Curvibacter soli TaxID=3031331 RepID=UPI0023DC7CA2|nr:O-antigen ligase family protein [Ramlibacter sp. H39-3-26]MDF1486076.1 O-antigen ligase family protein [Ramlibacter sp. H39-3-26]
MKPPSFLHAMPWPRQLATLAAFMVPGLALWLPSGYSYGAGLLFVGALLTIRRWPFQQHDRLTYLLAILMLAMAVLWIALSDPREHAGQWDRPVKFLLGAGCLLFVTINPPRPQALFWGLVVGCFGAGAIAAWQVYVKGAWRASGHTNAIQYGNLALLLAVMLAMLALGLRRQLTRPVKLLALVAVLAGLNASVLSLSRGGWLALLVATPVGLVLLFQIRRQALWKAVVGLVAAVAIVCALNFDLVTQRWGSMESEVQTYDQRGDADTSVGQRLEHWRLAWDMGRERPLLGWGVAGYLAEKAARVAAGKYHTSILEYIYVHNEMLDLFVKVGLAGMAVVLCFYALPIYMFWPSRARLAAWDAQPRLRSQVLALRLCGLCIPVLYIGFGLTQVFFAHNSGIMFYLFSNMLVWAALLGLERQLPGSAAPPANAAPH